MALRGSMLAKDTAGTTLGNTQLVADQVNAQATTRAA
jgi:hypothetical protein